MITTPMDAEFLQHSFDPDVAGRCLLVVGVIKRKCLLERKQILGAVAPVSAFAIVSALEWQL